MPNSKWSELSRLQLGRYAEYYAKMEFASYGAEIYTPEVDDHGVDFLARLNGFYYEVQVKAQRKGAPYTFIHKTKMDIYSPARLVCLIQFFPNQEPSVFIIPATVWQTPNEVFLSRDYEGKKSKPEWGIQYSKKNAALFEQHTLHNFITRLHTPSPKGII